MVHSIPSVVPAPTISGTARMNSNERRAKKDIDTCPHTEAMKGGTAPRNRFTLIETASGGRGLEEDEDAPMHAVLSVQRNNAIDMSEEDRGWDESDTDQVPN